MAKIVAVHGIGQQFKGEETLRQEWLSAVKNGLNRVNYAFVSDVDLACGFYGDLFRPQGKAALEPLFDASDIREEWERDLLLMWWSEAAQVERTVRSLGAQTKVRTPQVVQRALHALSRSSFFSGLSERALIYDLKQVYRYFHDAKIRQTAIDRVDQAVEPDARVLVGHSLGSIVAYEALCVHPDWPIVTFVTLGSPLAIRNLIFDQLQPRPGGWPGMVKRWFNIADRGDVVALEKELAGLFGTGVEDRLVYNGAHAHDVVRYLSTKEAGDAIASGL